MKELQKFLEWKNLADFLQTNMLKIITVVIAFKISGMLKKYADKSSLTGVDLSSKMLGVARDKGFYDNLFEDDIERAYKESEIEEILQELNLNIINKFDGYLNNNVQANSERIVYIVKKK